MAEIKPEPEKEVKSIVLIAMDGSEHSNAAFKWYMQHIHRPEHHVLLLHISERNEVAGALGATSEGGSVQAMMAETEQRETTFLDILSKKLKSEGIGGKVKSVTGKPGEAICQVANDENVTFIVTGTRGLGRIKRTFVSSVSDYILHHAHCPCIVVKNREK